MKTSIALSLLACAVFSGSFLSAQNTAREESRDYVYLKGREFIKGTIAGMDSTGLHLRSELGASLFYPYSQVRKIVRRPPLMELLHANYAELGITYGLPGGINFVAGCWFGRAGARLSGMYYGEDFCALQLHAGYKLQDNNRWRHSIGFSYGRMGSLKTGEGIGYAGLVYNYTGPPLKIRKSHHAWFAEVGYGRYFNTGKDELAGGGSFGPILQLGYLHRFIRHAPRYEVIPVPHYPKPCPKQKRPRIVNKNVKVKQVTRKGKPCPEPQPCPDCPACPQAAPPFPPDGKPVEVEVKQPQILLRIRDNGIPDGDVVSLELNGVRILSEHLLSKEEKEIPVELLPGKDNCLVLIAHNMGERPPCTSIITIADGSRNKKVVFNADLNAPGSIRFVWKN